MARHEGNSQQDRLFEAVLAELQQLGYSGDLIQRDYSLRDWFSADQAERTVPAALFAQTPVAYDSACFAVLRSNGRAGVDLISDYRALGAPRAFEVRRDRVIHWRVTTTPSAADAQLVIEPNQITPIFRANADHWRPASVLRAKNISPAGPCQLDFIDLGLIPALEAHVREKLDPLLRGILHEAVVEHKRSLKRAPDSELLFRLVFRSLAGKIMHDRGLEEFRSITGAADADVLLDQVARHYGEQQPVVADASTRQLVVERLWQSVSFRNLSVEVLAFIWENTLVTDDVRARLGIHATPPSIARYIVRNLPIEDIPENQRRVVEPCCGSATFLVAALRQLRDLLPASVRARERHSYFTKTLSGFDTETFGLEVARPCLMLADFPNPDGWNLVREDVFDAPRSAPRFFAALKDARVVLCNPPFADFTPIERHRYRPRSIHKPVEVLSRVLDHLQPQGLLGFVLPAQALDGRGYRDVRRELVKRFEAVEIVSLPGTVFLRSEQETALLIAKQPRTMRSSFTVRHRKVDDAGRSRFLATYEAVREDIQDKSVESAVRNFTVLDLREVWEYLGGLPKLCDVATIHRGVEWQEPFDEDKYVSSRPKVGFRPGLLRLRDKNAGEGVRNSTTLFSLESPAGVPYLSFRESDRRGNAFDLPWAKPKVIMNAVRRTRGAWRITATADYDGLAVSQNFHAIWPLSDYSPKVITALLNSPVASAFVAAHSRGKHITKKVLAELPIPHLSSEDREVLGRLVGQYSDSVGKLELERSVQAGEPRSVLLECDARVLRAYGLSPRLERTLLEFFRGHRRPVSFEFGDYYPPDFGPFIPLHEYLSEEYRRSTAGELRERHRPAPSPAVLDALERAVAAFEEA